MDHLFKPPSPTNSFFHSHSNFNSKILSRQIRLAFVPLSGYLSGGGDELDCELKSQKQRPWCPFSPSVFNCLKKRHVVPFLGWSRTHSPSGSPISSGRTGWFGGILHQETPPPPLPTSSCFFFEVQRRCSWMNYTQTQSLSWLVTIIPLIRLSWSLSWMFLSVHSLRWFYLSRQG